jgi:hypothetical protein
VSRKYQKFLKEQIVPHLGHFIRVKVEHNKMPVYGKFIRMNLRPDELLTEIWVESKPHPIVVYDAQFLGCACLDPSLKGEWSYH